MHRVGIVGGETHIGEVTALAGDRLEIVGAAVRDDQAEWASETFGCPVVGDYQQLLSDLDTDIISVANENDFRGEVILAALQAGKDIICDKPLCLSMDDQDAIEQMLADNPDRRVLNLLTLRGQPRWMALRDVVRSGRIGTPAFVHIRMAVRLKRDQRPPWFLDYNRSGGLFLDLLIHGLDQVEWLTGRKIVAVSANQGNLGDPAALDLRDHAAVYCELDDGASAICEGQRMLPDTKASDYRVTIAATSGHADLLMAEDRLVVTDREAADVDVTEAPDSVSIVADWLDGGDVVPQEASLRANRIAILATMAAEQSARLQV